MRNVVTSIFKENEFQIITPDFLQDREDFFAVSTNHDRATYFVVLFKDETIVLEDLNQEFDTYFRELKRLEEGYDRRIDKNVTLLLCLRRKGLPINENLNRLIFELEEDPYHFKKLVLPYTTVEVNALKAELALGNKLYEILNDRKEFYRFKKDPYEESKYNLVSKLFIKLPFLHFSNFNEDIERLTETIENELTDKDVLQVRNETLQLIAEINEKQLGDEERFERLMTWAVGANHE
jgi:hypothetical protein